MLYHLTPVTRKTVTLYPGITPTTWDEPLCVCARGGGGLFLPPSTEWPVHKKDMQQYYCTRGGISLISFLRNSGGNKIIKNNGFDHPDETVAQGMVVDSEIEVGRRQQQQQQQPGGWRSWRKGSVGQQGRDQACSRQKLKLGKRNSKANQLFPELLSKNEEEAVNCCVV